MATPALLSDGRMEPRQVIGSVDTAEFAVSAAASLGFLVGLGSAGVHWGLALTLLAGGLLAAPLAAWLVRLAPTHLLGVVVGGMIVLTNSRTLLSAGAAGTPIRLLVYAVVVTLTVGGVLLARARARRPEAVTVSVSG